MTGTVYNSYQDEIIVQRVPKVMRPGLARNVWRVNVLLVEDDPADAELIKQALSTHPQVGAIDVRNTPEAALADLKSEGIRPTIILVDIHMPKLDGFEFTATLRTLRVSLDVPVVFLTTSRSSRDVEAARNSTACGYIVKPERFEDLKFGVHNLINQMVVGRRKP